jgi:predicted component of type VI protein secretion system
VLPDKRAPLRGLYLHATETGVFFVRLASSQTKNDKGLQGWLAVGETLEVGHYRIAARVSNNPTDPDAPLPDMEGRDLAPPHPVLMVVHQEKTIAYNPLRRRLAIVGRDQHCAVRLADPQVSSAHCILYRENDKLWAIDLLSSNGTSIAGQPLEAGMVVSGQTLVLGDYTKLVYMSAPQASDNLDELTQDVTGLMVQFSHQTRWRRRLLAIVATLLVALGLAAAVLFLPEDYLANLWKQILLLWSQEG